MSIGFQLKQVFGSAAREALADDNFDLSILLQEFGDIADMNAKMLREKATLENMQSILEQHIECVGDYHSAEAIRDGKAFLEKVFRELSANETRA